MTEEEIKAQIMEELKLLQSETFGNDIILRTCMQIFSAQIVPNLRQKLTLQVRDLAFDADHGVWNYSIIMALEEELTPEDKE